MNIISISISIKHIIYIHLYLYYMSALFQTYKCHFNDLECEDPFGSLAFCPDDHLPMPCWGLTIGSMRKQGLI